MRGRSSGDGSGTNNPDLLTPPPHLLDAPPYEWDPFFDLDWSLALRGAYVTGESGARYEGLAVPSVTLTHQTLRGGYELSGSAEITTEQRSTPSGWARCGPRPRPTTRSMR